jgi:hypothetical protein
MCSSHTTSTPRPSAPLISPNNSQNVRPTAAASVEGAKDKMRELMGAQGVADAEKALPPQIFNGDMYCGVSHAIFSVARANCRAVNRSAAQAASLWLAIHEARQWRVLQ